MIFILVIIFIFYILNNNKEYFIVDKNDIFKNKFLDLIEKFNLEGELNINYPVNIISSVNKKYLNLDGFNNKFDSLMIKNLFIKKLKPKNKFYIFNINKLYLFFNELTTIPETKINNLDDNNEFDITEISNIFDKLDYNKFRFKAKIKIKNKYLGSNGFTKHPETLFFDLKMTI